MKVLRTASEVRSWRAAAGRVGLVPTMGALHAGHASLVERAVREGQAAAVSIFVNPTQFGPHEDFTAYPRNMPADLALLERLGASMVFAPEVSEMYPPGDTARVEPGPIAARLEGAARPGHFAGVATVVARLFAIVRPDVAYFGQKDYQQLRVIQTMVRQRRLGVRIVGCETVREPDGLAMSSRNAYLSPDDRPKAQALSRGLFAARDAFARGERDAATLRGLVEERAREAGALDYVSVADPVTLDELAGRVERAVVSLAARVGTTRLIDNVLVGIRLEDLA